MSSPLSAKTIAARTSRPPLRSQSLAKSSSAEHAGQAIGATGRAQVAPGSDRPAGQTLTETGGTEPAATIVDDWRLE